jgi:hypothetical protein
MHGAMHPVDGPGENHLSDCGEKVRRLSRLKALQDAANIPGRAVHAVSRLGRGERQCEGVTVLALQSTEAARQPMDTGDSEIPTVGERRLRG